MKFPQIGDWLAKYGKFVGRRPGLVTAVGLLVCCTLSLGWLQALRRDIMRSADEFELIWAFTGSTMEQEIKWVKNLHNADPWENKPILTMIKGKGELQDADLITPQVFEDLLPLYKRFHDISVTTASGLVYTSRDLCARGSMPDYPGDAAACAQWAATNRTDALLGQLCMPTPIMPCMITTPLDCFAEAVDILDPSYAPLDLVADKVLPSQLAAKPYATRPSWRNSTATQMKATVSQQHLANAVGCPWWTETVVYSPTAWAGGLEMSSSGVVTRATSLRWSIFTEGPRRAAFRMSLTKPEHAKEEEIKAAIELLDEAWMREVEEFAERHPNLEMVNMDLAGGDRAQENGNKPRWLGMILGGVFMNLFVVLSLASWRYPELSRVSLGLGGLGPVGLGIAASGGIFLLMGFKFNSSIVMGLPFLALGLGVNDLFVLIQYFSGLGLRYIQDADYAEIIGAVFREAAVGVSLTSACNVVAFGAGCLLPVVAMADFCVAAAIVAAVNYFVMMTVIPGLLVMEARRIKRGEPELSPIYICHRRRSAASSRTDPTTVETSALAAMMEKRYGWTLAKPWCIFSVSLLAIGLIGISCAGIVQKTVGYKPAELVEPSDNLHRGLELLFSEFATWPSMLCFVDVDVPNKQQEMLQLYEQVSSTGNTAPFELLPYLSNFYFYIHYAGLTPVGNVTMADMGWRLHPSKWNHSTLAPFGIASDDSDLFYSQYGAWNNMPLTNPAKALTPGGDSFVMADLSGANEFRHSGGSATSPLRFSFFRFYQTGLTSDEEYMRSIEHVRAIVDASPLKGHAFPYGPIFTFWSVFSELEPILLRALAIDLAAVFLLKFIFLRSLTVALLSTLACAMIVLEVYGLGMFFLQFNIFAAAALLACVGISVEFTAHLAAAFALEGKGLPTDQRLGKALAQTGPAIIQGSLSTFCGILPMAFDPIPFAAKYLFGPFALIVLVGVVNGLVVLPVSFAAFDYLGSCVFNRSQAPSDSEASQSPHNLPTVLTSGATSSADTAEKRVSV